MDTTELRSNLLQLIQRITDENELKKAHQFICELIGEDKDWNSLSGKVREDTLKSYESYLQGDRISHQEAMKLTAKKYSQLNSEMKIVFTSISSLGFDQVVDYLTEKWSFKTAKKFTAEIVAVISSIHEHPYLCQASRFYPYLQIGKITRYNGFLYHVAKNEIVILNFFDIRVSEK